MVIILQNILLSSSVHPPPKTLGGVHFIASARGAKNPSYTTGKDNIYKDYNS